MKIAVVETDAKGGLIHFAYHLAEALSEQGHQATLVTGEAFELTERQGAIRVAPILKLWPQVETNSQARPDGFAHIKHKLRRAWRGIVLIREWTRLTVYLLRERPDVAIFSVIRFPFLFIFLTVLRLAGIRLAQICHEFAQRDRQLGPMRHFRYMSQGLGYRCFETIFFLAKATQKEFLKTYRFSGGSCVLPHPPQLFFHDVAVPPAGLREMFDLGPTDKMVLFFGLLRPSKGVDQLIEAFAQVPTRHDARLVISGYPTKMFDTKAIRQHAKSLGIEARCRFHFDYLPNEMVGPLMEMAAIVVFPYRNATASGALALAQSFAKPVIVTRVGGLMEAVTDGETGITVPPENPTAIAQAIDDLLADADKANQLGQNAKQVLTQERSWAVAAARVSAQLTPKN